jgi:hypothetical protein
MSNRKMRDLKAEVKKYRYSSERGYGVPAQVAGEELERIAAVNGGFLKTEAVIEESKPENAPLHPVFEWDLEKAANEHWKQQARSLIRAVVVVSVEEPGDGDYHGYYRVTVPEEPKPVYVSSEVVVQSPALFADAVARLERVLSQARSSVEDLERLARDVGDEPERLARIALAMKAIEAAGAAVAALH